MSAENEQPQAPAPKIQNRSIQVQFPDSFTYSNASAFSTSGVDIRIAFAEALPSGEASTKVGIVMAPEHAAHVVLNLLAQLNFFEENFGQIRHRQWRAFRDTALRAATDELPTPTDDPSPE